LTDKKDRILESALELFASNGFHATSTSKVAKAAGVSEGLIFRHFENKEGLLESLMERGAEKVHLLYQDVLLMQDPREKLKAMISLPFQIKEEEYPFWKLLYALKWQAESYDSTMTEPIVEHLIQCFKALGYPDPQTEADTVMMIQDGVATTILLKKPLNKHLLQKSLLNKYGL
jgi:AcrR family transcriptional regulator